MTIMVEISKDPRKHPHTNNFFFVSVCVSDQITTFKRDDVSITFKLYRYIQIKKNVSHVYPNI